MFFCSKCHKEFQYKSKLDRHEKSKKSCGENKESDVNNKKCNLCKIEFKHLSNKLQHDKSKRHIKLYNNEIHTNSHNITNSYNTTNNYINNLTLSINTFEDTKFNFMRRMLIKDIIENQFVEYLKQSTTNTDKGKLILRFMDGIIEIFEHLNFNIAYDENHNCKILLLFPSTNKKHFEYLILEKNPINNDLEWEQVNYDGMLSELLKLMYKVLIIIKDERLKNTLDYLTENLLNDEDIQLKIKVDLENKLEIMYNKFRKRSNKEDRADIPKNSTMNERMDEYKNYRADESRMTNGHNPKINNSLAEYGQ